MTRAVLTYHSLDESRSPISLAPAVFEKHVEWLTSGRVAMLCGAITGLIYGLFESISFAALNYSIHPTPAYNHLIRFLVMAPGEAPFREVKSAKEGRIQCCTST